MLSSPTLANSKSRNHAILFLLTATLLVPPPAMASEGEPLTLRRAVALAVQNSRELALARLQYVVADREAGMSRAAFRPNLYAGTGAAYSSGFPLDAPSVVRLQFVQTLFNRPLKGAQREAEERAAAGKINIDQARDLVTVRAATAYLELVKVRSALRILQEERSSADKIVGVTQQRIGEGLELPIEVTRAQLSSAKVAQQILQLEGREDYLEGELRRMTGSHRGASAGGSRSTHRRTS
ncbi:MAG: TolC family protein [Acidobacteria bacterium]|nr:TolC family protein [Acidobacteriota bacterium]